MGITAWSYATFISFQGLKVPRWKTSNWHKLSYSQNIHAFQVFSTEKLIKKFLSATKVIQKKILLLFLMPQLVLKKLNFQVLSAKTTFKKLHHRNKNEILDRFIAYCIGFSKIKSIDKVASIIEILKILITVKKSLECLDLQVFFCSKTDQQTVVPTTDT